MTIEAQLPGGTTLQFPDGTPDAVIQGAVKQHLSQQPADASQTPEAKMGLTPAPPEPPLPPTLGDTTASQPGEATAPAWMSQRSLVDTSITPGPNVGNTAPLSRDPASGDIRLALPNPVRALLTEGPQYDEKTGFKVPAATIDTSTGSLGLTPEAISGGMLLSGVIPRHPLLGDPRFVPPGTFDPRAPLSPEFKANPLSLEARAAATAEPGGAGTPTGIAPPPQPPPQPQPAAPSVPTTAPANPPIMSEADIQARGRGYFNAADQAASQGAMLPDTNATAVRKLFTDFIPNDPEAARISASQPAMQAAKNVEAAGPMSYDTAMRIDRDLTSRMRSASGSDAHDLSQLQQGLRDQMDLVPDLDNLRPGRQAWMQSIKQGQMEDINAGAALKNDPAQADAYVRQRAAALLKNNNAMRYWTPEEQAQLTQVAQSGNIGMLGRLATALIKPATRVVFGAAGHTVAGPLGAIVGAEVGGDIGATAASKLRSYMSPTDLDAVMRQITLGVPPPNQLGPQP